MRRQQSVLILDDVWNHFVLEKVEIPVRVNGCKLILTTRLLDACRRLGCQVKIKVEPFSREEAWSLFLEKVGYGVALPPESWSKRYCMVCCKRMCRSATFHNRTGWKHEGSGWYLYWFVCLIDQLHIGLRKTPMNCRALISLLLLYMSFTFRFLHESIW